MKKIIGFIIFCLAVSLTPVLSGVKAGGVAPNIALRNISNKMVLSKNILKEKPMLISFFFTECMPCRKEIPELQKLNEKYKNKIQMYLIATDAQGADVVEPYIKEMNITIEVLIDKYSDIAKLYNVTKYPTVYIIGKNGKIVYSCEGYDEKNISAIDKILQDMK